MAEAQSREFPFYMSIGKEKTTPVFKLVNKGITEISENPNAKVETVQYVLDKSESSTISGYSTAFNVTGAVYKSAGVVDPVGEELHEIGTMQPIGDEAERFLVSVDVSGLKDGVDVYPARMFTVAVKADSFTSAAGTSKKFSMQLLGIGDFKVGTFDIATLEFKEPVTP